ncbi:hypothetical protein ACIOJF_13770 [Glutamicibacter sp. NPDC087831]|uniref:hypothetical protein n=1 Tax=Glutamicibacter sp. NPDC087831 TaxID=3363998 RepID=UPI0038116291
MSTSLGRSGKIEIRTGSSVEDWAGIMDAAGLRDMTQNERVQRLLPLLQDPQKSGRLLRARRIASEYRQLQVRHRLSSWQ